MGFVLAGIPLKHILHYRHAHTDIWFETWVYLWYGTHEVFADIADAIGRVHQKAILFIFRLYCTIGGFRPLFYAVRSTVAPIYRFARQTHPITLRALPDLQEVCTEVKGFTSLVQRACEKQNPQGKYGCTWVLFWIKWAHLGTRPEYVKWYTRHAVLSIKSRIYIAFIFR